MTETRLATVNDFAVNYTEAVITADFDAMQVRLDELMEPYKGLTADVVATMDPKEVKECYRDLNAIRTSVEDGRKAIKREYNKPLAAFEAKVKELVDQIDKPRALLKEAKDQREAMEKAQRFSVLEDMYQDFAPALADLVPLESVIDERWLNKSYGQKKAENELCDRVAGINADWKTLKDADLHFPEETERRFFDTLSLRDAMTHDVEEWNKQQALNTMKAEVSEITQAPEIITPTPQVFEDDLEYRFTIAVPEQEFFTNVIEATALKNHLAKLGIQAHMTKSRKAVA